MDYDAMRSLDQGRPFHLGGLIAANIEAMGMHVWVLYEERSSFYSTVLPHFVC